jgi:hypothetical protein
MRHQVLATHTGSIMGSGWLLGPSLRFFVLGFVLANWLHSMLYSFRVPQQRESWMSDSNSKQQQACLCTNSTASTDKDSGWHAVDVFVGHRSYFHEEPDGKFPHTNLSDSVVGWYYGQVQEDYIVFHLLRFKRQGYFLDLAANHAYNISNTFSLERFFDWDGLCMDANPMYWMDLARMRTCHVVGAAVGGLNRAPKTEPTHFRMKNVYGGIVSNGFDNGGGGGKDETITPLFTVPVSEVLERYNVQRVIDYMSLDVEGAESYVMVRYTLL